MKIEINDEINKKRTIFIIFFVFLLLPNHFIWLFHDDYGYASLSYLPAYIGYMGMNSNIINIINFLIYHYKNWGGRVLYF